MKSKALVIVAHPHLRQSVANKSIIESLKDIENVTLHNLYDTYPYFHIDIKKEQNLLRAHNLIVFQHPFLWYNMPALLKLWVDEVLTSGFAYGPGGDELKNKKFQLSITAGGDVDTYQDQGTHRHSVDQFLTGYKQICHLCQMRWLEPLVLYGSRKTESEHLMNHVEEIKKTIQFELTGPAYASR